MVEIVCLGHFLKESISAMKATMNKLYSHCKRVLDKVAALGLSSICCITLMYMLTYIDVYMRFTERI